MSPPAGLVWIFGYGSLMWRPGFTHAAFEPARLDGWHRAFCITSRHWRGTAACPGLVLGLAPGGQCSGRAIGIERAAEAEVLDYLDGREFVGGIYVYERARRPIALLGCGTRVDAWCYLARPEHPDYAGGLPAAAVVERLRRAVGSAGTNRDYALNTVAHLQAMGISDAGMEELVAGLTS